MRSPWYFLRDSFREKQDSKDIKWPTLQETINSGTLKPANGDQGKILKRG